MWLHTYCMHHLFLTGHERSVFTVTQGAEHVLHDPPFFLQGMKGPCLQSPKGLNMCCMIHPFVLQGMKGPCLQSPKGLNMCCMIHPFVLRGMKGPCLQSPKGLNTCCMIHPFFLQGMKGPCLQSPKELDQSNVAAQSCYSVRPAVQVQCCFKPTDTIRTIRDREPSMPWPLHLSHSS